MLSTILHILIVVLIVIVVLFVVLYILGSRMQKRQNAQQEQMEAAKQTVTMLVIDKKKLPVKQSGLPQMVIDQTPKLMRRSKLPIVKAKVGPRVMTLISDDKIFDQIPLKKEVKAVISGIYIMDVRGVRGPLEKKPEGKRGLRVRAMNYLDRKQKELAEDTKNKPAKKAKPVKAPKPSRFGKSKHEENISQKEILQKVKKK